MGWIASGMSIFYPLNGMLQMKDCKDCLSLHSISIVWVACLLLMWGILSQWPLIIKQILHYKMHDAWSFSKLFQLFQFFRLIIPRFCWISGCDICYLYNVSFAQCMDSPSVAEVDGLLLNLFHDRWTSWLVVCGQWLRSSLVHPLWTSNIVVNCILWPVLSPRLVHICFQCFNLPMAEFP